jgi:hypothetical protein
VGSRRRESKECRRNTKKVGGAQKGLNKKLGPHLVTHYLRPEFFTKVHLPLFNLQHIFTYASSFVP